MRCDAMQRAPATRRNTAAPASAGRGLAASPGCAGPYCRLLSGRCCWPRRRPVYPRVCGGTARTGRTARRSKGLSPRVRVNPTLQRKQATCLRSIPACAGEPQVMSSRTWPGEVYPRVCGGTPWPFDNASCYLIRQGNNADPLAVIYQIHPSPSTVSLGAFPGVNIRRTRASAAPYRLLRKPFARTPPTRRFTIAKIGKPTGRKVYPRVCGGTGDTPYHAQRKQGLSPRVRGNPCHRHRADDRPRSIPACAGEPSKKTRCGSTTRVYPRVCGGTHRRPDAGERHEGLSPRVRGNRANTGSPRRKTRVYPRVCGGTHRRPDAGEGHEGLSPRVRGNRANTGSPRRKTRVYPRVCGGTRHIPASYDSHGGLSPRVRGNLALPLFASAHARSIPACAGEPVGSTAGIWMLWVYPRVCGGTDGRNLQAVSGGGLSPRVRGNPAAAGVQNDRQRSIPACAGEPKPPSRC